jgi:hypothetical protein
MQITFTLKQVLQLLEHQRELSLQDAWSMYEDSVNTEDAKPFNKAGFFSHFRDTAREPADITILKKYITQ